MIVEIKTGELIDCLFGKVDENQWVFHYMDFPPEVMVGRDYDFPEEDCELFGRTMLVRNKKHIGRGILTFETEQADAVGALNDYFERIGYNAKASAA